MTSRTQPITDRNMAAAAFGHVRGRGHSDNQIKFFTIAEVAERLHVSGRTIRRWIRANDLVAHRIKGNRPGRRERSEGVSGATSGRLIVEHACH